MNKQEVRSMFETKIGAIVDRVPEEKRADFAAAVDGLLISAASLDDKAAVGKYVGKRLKDLELEYAPPVPSKTKEQKVQELFKAGVIDGERQMELLSLIGEPGVGKVIEGAYGHLVSTSRDAPLIIAYTMIEGFMFERSRARIARTLGFTGTPYRGKKVTVSFIGVRNGIAKSFSNIPIDNDVPLVPDHIWETKRYTRLDYGTHEETYNQLLKYQAAIDAGHFKGATVEVYGNIAPAFFRALIDCAQVTPGLFLEVPDVEVLYVLDEQTAIPLRRSRARSLARGATGERATPYVRALADKRYGIFSGRIITADDIPSELALLHRCCAQGITVDPERIMDVAAFRGFEQLVQKKREKLLGISQS